MNIPLVYYHRPFFEDKTITITGISFEEKMRQCPFYFDISEEVKPWTDKHFYVPKLFQIWGVEENNLRLLFRQRKSAFAKPIMTLMVALFIDLLFWSNEQRVLDLGDQFFLDLDTLTYKPINCKERLEFILQSLDQYHALIQLSALFEEHKKGFAKMVILEKKNQEM
ncbi:YpoC family protein [Bacillus suaedae]|uniref:YpoC-like domain-containing protein n=1 Tax=Halalkalibacter suaedae TaxID=2822140 RepID=A0A940WRU5_9BACI|nr:hypothetical protein [Bacillus suaedae]MBP3950633.1 hypothetical protein [Bacillus suaedae]